MKRVIAGWVLIGLGVFLVVVAILANFWVPGQVQKTPKAVNTNTYLSGPADKLNLDTGKPESMQVKITVLTKTDSVRSTDDVDVWVQTVCVVQDTGNPPACLRSSDPRLIQVSQTTFATNRVTGEATNDPKYFVGVSDVSPSQGLMNKFPFNTEKKTYQLWDDTLGTTSPATYRGTDDLDGLETYKFHVSIKDAKIEIADGINGTYNLEKDVWVEPITGAIVDQSQHDVRTLEDGTTALDMKVAFTEATRTEGIDDGKSNVSQFKLLTDTVPLVGFIAGVLILICGLVIVLLARSRVTEEYEDAEPTPVAH